MKLAEALGQRKQYKDRIDGLLRRVQASATYLEGEQPAENAVELLDITLQLQVDLRALIARINLTNAATKDESGTTLTEMLAARDYLRAVRGSLLRAAQAVEGGHRYGRDELVRHRVLEPAGLYRQAEQVHDEAVALDAKIQQLNWTTDLI
jgi:hypothetical protein